MSHSRKNGRGRSALLISLAAHAGLLFCLIGGGLVVRSRPAISTAHPISVARIEVAGGSRRLYLPKDALPGPPHDSARRVKEQRNHRNDPVRPPVAPHSAPSAPLKTMNGTGGGSADRGSGSDAQDATPAFPVFSPKPRVSDRALLPGEAQKVVVEVSVSEAGDVTGETLVHGLGNALDQAVLDTVKTWRFQPATVNGKPVASQADVIFPFDENYPLTGV